VHMNVLAKCDFFTVEVLSLARVGDLLCVLLSASGKPAVHIAGITRHPDQEWMEQMGHTATQEWVGLSSLMPLCTA
jgi:hypothetical protein